MSGSDDDSGFAARAARVKDISSLLIKPPILASLNKVHIIKFLHEWNLYEAQIGSQNALALKLAVDPQVLEHIVEYDGQSLPEKTTAESLSSKELMAYLLERSGTQSANITMDVVLKHITYNTNIKDAKSRILTLVHDVDVALFHNGLRGNKSNKVFMKDLLKQVVMLIKPKNLAKHSRRTRES